MKLFIDNLPFGISKSELLNLFKEFGEVVHANLVNDRYMGRSKGFAFVEMDTIDVVLTALVGYLFGVSLG